MVRARPTGDLTVALWAAVLAVALLGPALGSGPVIGYDMVWVPDLAMRPDFLGLGSALPRAVPSDAVVAALGTVVPGVLLQKLVLLGLLVAGGVGAARLAPPDVTAARLLAVGLWTWNPFVVERLAIGHWPVLVGYAVLPWLLRMAAARRTGASAPGLWALLVVGSLSASAGLATAVVALAFGLRLRRDGRRADVVLVLGVLAANAPWWVVGLAQAGAATGGAASTAPFAISPSAGLPAPVAALGLGGIWNVDVAAPRGTVAAVLGLALLVGLAALGARSWARSTGRRDVVAYGACWALGLGVALLGWAAPGVVAALAAVPGGGLLRDGGRTLSLCAPALVALSAAGAAVLVRAAGAGRPGRTGRPAGGAWAPRVGWTLAAALVPVALIPGAAWGLGGRLEPVAYPASWQDARQAVLASDVTGDLLLLPLSAYRAPEWNGGRPVLDPLGRYLPRDVVAADDLVVSGRTVPGEDPRVDEVAAALGASDPGERARRLAVAGVGLVATDLTAGGDAPAVTGAVVHRSEDLEVVGLAGAVSPRPTAARVAAAAAAWAAWWGCLVASATGAWRVRGRRADTPVRR